MLVGINAMLIGSVAVGIPLCVYAIKKDVSRELKEKEDKRVSEQIELMKMQIELKKLERQSQAVESEEIINTRGLFE